MVFWTIGVQCYYFYVIYVFYVFQNPKGRDFLSFFLPCFLELWCLCCINRKQSVQEGSGRGTPKKSSGPSSPSRSKSPTSAQSQPGSPVHSYGKLIVCKRFCQRVGDVADDPIELRLLYAQAVHYVVHVRPPCYHVISYIIVHL